ncbi:MAG: methyltransferase, partial [Candidatus Binatia bacterium]
MVDVGGGQGTLVASILKVQSNTRGMLFDVPHVIAASRARMVNINLADRCEFVAGDFFVSVPAGGELHVLAVVDIGAGTTDIAVMARFDGKDSILAEATVPSGGRAIQRLFHRTIMDRFNGHATDLTIFHRLLRDGVTDIGGNPFTIDDLFNEPDAMAWVESVHNRLIEVKSRAQAMNYIQPA